MRRIRAFAKLSDAKRSVSGMLESMVFDSRLLHPTPEYAESS